MGPQDRPGEGHRPVRVDGASGQAREGTPACEG